MEIKKIITKEMDQNCYLIEENGRGILIDPGLDTSKILKETEDIDINYILLTHCHFDHIFSCNYLNKNVVASENCKRNIKNPDIVLYNTSLKQDNIIVLKDKEEKEFDGIKVKCIYTPGHTDGSVCYLINNNLFSGDTLFKRSIGRCDLPTGDMKTLENSIRNIIYKLDDNITVYPGHGEETNIGYEKKYNLYFTE